MAKKNIGFGRKKKNKVLKKLIRNGLIIALIFLLLSWALDILNNMSHDWDIFIKKHNQQASTIELLQHELEILKSSNASLESRVNFTEASLNFQNELINDMNESLNQPSWSNQGVTYQYQVIETTENYDVVEPTAEVKAPAPEMPGFFSPSWTIAPIVAAGGMIIKTILTRGIPAF